jgi:microsomal dipeptidase-like Zn-dependent dipeptidase
MPPSTRSTQTLPIFDLHGHPSLKYSLLKGEKFYVRHHSVVGPWSYLNPLEVYYDAPGAVEGNVTILVDAHYVPENGFRKSALLSLLQRVGATDVLEESDPPDSNGKPMKNCSAWEKLMESMRLLERMANEANQKLSNIDVQILGDPRKFNRLRKRNAPNVHRLLLIHGIEGAHHLGRHLGEPDNPQPYIDRLAELKRHGFCVFTLSHFFLNDLCDTAGGIPTADYPVSTYKIPVAQTPGLTVIGDAVVEWALKNGFLLDLVHSTTETRKKVYDINRTLAKRGILPKLKPLAFTHTGVRSLYRLGKDATYESLNYLPDEDDMRAIGECQGIMGLILMKNWLNGVDDDEPLQEELVEKTIKEIIKGTGSYRCVGIGTDLDGFTHVPDNLNHCSKLTALRDMICHSFPAQAYDILFGNAERVFLECCLHKASGRAPNRRRR